MTDQIYTVMELDLSVAGDQEVDGPWGFFHFVRAVDASGAAQADSLIQARAGRDRDDIPLTPGGKVGAPPSRRWRLEWAAQSGITATVLFAERAGVFDIDMRPPSALVSSGFLEIQSPLKLVSFADISMAATATTQIRSGSGKKTREAFISNPPGNPREIRIADGSAGAGRGFVLMPGQTIPITTLGTIKGYNPHSAAMSIAVVETRDD